MSEIIYILTNPAIPNLVKIGRTEDLERRVRDLSSHSAVPIPFEIYYACTVSDANIVERRIHEGFSDHRVNKKREFFQIHPERILSILKLVEIDDVTPSSDCVEDKEEQETLNKARQRKSNFKFSTVDIGINSVLSFIKDENIQATVVDDRNIEFEGKVTSLSQAALITLNRNFNEKRQTVCGPDFWIYESEALSERRLRLENER